MDYRKKAFRGAKIEDCILDFENMRQTSEHKAQISTDEYRKRLYDGMAISYQTVVSRLCNDFDYNLEMINLKNPLEKWKNDFERMANSCTEQAKKPLDITNVPGGIRDEIGPEMQEGLFEGMATGYKMIVSQMEIIIELGTNENNLQKIVKLLKEQLTKKSNDITVILKEKDGFKNGFYSGLKSSYISAIAHL